MGVRVEAQYCFVDDDVSDEMRRWNERMAGVLKVGGFWKYCMAVLGMAAVLHLSRAGVSESWRERQAKKGELLVVGGAAPKWLGWGLCCCILS
jgi:hypothetical protein